MFERISSTDALSVISPRISANFVSASDVSVGSTTRNGTSTNSKWLR